MTSEQKPNNIDVFGSSDLDSLMVTYGRRIYERLLERCGNKEIAKEALKEVLVDLYTAMQTSGCSNPLEAIMYMQAEEHQKGIIHRSFNLELEDLLVNISNPDSEVNAERKEARQIAIPAPEIRTDTVSSEAETKQAVQSTETEAENAAETTEVSAAQLQPKENRKEKKDIRPLVGVPIIIFLILFICALLWCIAGLVMGTGFVPKIDLGYNWFNTNIMAVF